MLNEDLCIPVNDEQDADVSCTGKNLVFFRAKKPDFWLLTASKTGETRSLRSGLCSTIQQELIDWGVNMPIHSEENFEELLINQGDNGLRFVAPTKQEFMVYASNNPEFIARKIVKMLNK